MQSTIGLNVTFLLFFGLRFYLGYVLSAVCYSIHTILCFGVVLKYLLCDLFFRYFYFSNSWYYAFQWQNIFSLFLLFQLWYMVCCIYLIVCHTSMCFLTARHDRYLHRQVSYDHCTMYVWLCKYIQYTWSDQYF